MESIVVIAGVRAGNTVPTSARFTAVSITTPTAARVTRAARRPVVAGRQPRSCEPCHNLCDHRVWGEIGKGCCIDHADERRVEIGEEHWLDEPDACTEKLGRGQRYAGEREVRRKSDDRGVLWAALK